MTAQWAYDVPYSYEFIDSYTSTDITIKTTSGATWPTAPNIQRFGYTFNGWYTKDGTPVVAGGVAFRWLTSQTGDNALVANWKPNVYKLNYLLLNGGYPGTGSSYLTYTSGEVIASVPTTPWRTGYTFAGWYDGSVGPITTSYTPGDYKCNMNYYYVSACTVFLNAHWTPKATTITFSANGGRGSAPSNLTYTSGTPLSLPANPFTGPTGKSFQGWSPYWYNTTGSLSYNSPTNSATATLYAIWK
jgi:uncharacterized repeat protein (TIGR02543 family)